MADEAAWASWRPPLQPHPIFSRRVSGTNPAAVQEIQRQPSSQRPRERQLGSRPWVEMGSGWLQQPLMRETGTFHPSGKARQQQEGNREKVQAPRAGPGGFGVGVPAARAPPPPAAQPGAARRPHFHLRSAVWASGGLSRVQKAHRNRNGVAAKLDWLPMNGGPEQGQWWGRDTAPTLRSRGWVSWEIGS